ncbi:tRNA (adenosine(37)-N6)-threonylcarbamoyltransferase complex dimerization subunit type 1 TsaB, partial [candidate division WOR-3 bacterium]|nr:tRNA (adenosine(37)-N6)-threonylcarbamoyltransferase complex dimerization subunit type 1 TsaB [candidate division WOR-3 bacterium]MBD3364891.1 tRNA (adenosine(37)-N6)-threonylcarbamoyltransferase complex dimerization subunit type 1 TsaB [candidate division WOR-3 bacterium]
MSEVLLAIETSGRWTGVAVAEGSRVMAARQVETRNSHNEMLPGLVAEAMSKAGKDFCDLGLIGVSIGPGSFTALRIGLLYAAGIAFAHCMKIVTVMTLDVLNACLNVEDGIRLPLVDAYKGEVFTALYKG